MYSSVDFDFPIKSRISSFTESNKFTSSLLYKHNAITLAVIWEHD